jgi:hypothetical protein
MQTILRELIGDGRRRWRALCVALGFALALIVAAPAMASYEEGVAAMRRNDAATALRYLEPLAREGHLGARFQLGVLFAEGRGIAEDRRIALKWFMCATQGASDANFASAARNWQHRLSSGLDLENLRMVEAQARQDCVAPRTVEAERNAHISWRHQDIGPRHTVLGTAFFFPGDVFVTGVYQLAVAVVADVLADAITYLIRQFGDWFIGSLSVCIWCMAFRVAFIIAMALLAIDLMRRSKRLDPVAALRMPTPQSRPTIRSILGGRDKLFRP